MVIKTNPNGRHDNMLRNFTEKKEKLMSDLAVSFICTMEILNIYIKLKSVILVFLALKSLIYLPP